MPVASVTFGRVNGHFAESGMKLPRHDVLMEEKACSLSESDSVESGSASV